MAAAVCGIGSGPALAPARHWLRPGIFLFLFLRLLFPVVSLALFLGHHPLESSMYPQNLGTGAGTDQDPNWLELDLNRLGLFRSLNYHLSHGRFGEFWKLTIKSEA